jgi:hypothetical protein
MYCKTIFKNKFINCDFDNELIEMNNEFVNSNETYLDIKNNYLKTSNENLSKITLLIEEYDALSKNHCTSQSDNLTCHEYTFVNVNNLENINNKIKNLLKEQQYLYDNFTHYITFINSITSSTPKRYQEDVNQPQTIKITDRN